MARMVVVLLLCLVHDRLVGGAASTPPSCAAPPQSHAPSLLQVAVRHTGWQARDSHVASRRELGKRIQAASWGDGNGDELNSFDQDIAAYALRYREVMNGSLVAFFQHVSKTAGTLLCSMGKANGCRSPDSLNVPDAINCNLKDDRLVWRSNPMEVDPERRPATCEGLSAAYTGRGITLASTENYLIPAGLCPQFFNIMVLRDPIERLLSQLSMDFLFSRHQRTGRERWLEAPSPGDIFSQMPASSNNFFVRSMLGREVYTLPFGHVNSSHLSRAIHVLESFDLLLVGEKDEPLALTNEIGITLGWHERQHVKRNRGSTEKYNENLHWGQAEWDQLRANNALDMALWQRARHLDSIDKAVFLHPSFARVAGSLPRGSRGSCGFLQK